MVVGAAFAAAPAPEPVCAVADSRLGELSGLVVHDGGLGMAQPVCRSTGSIARTAA